jgi:protein xylosyltransferase
MRKLQGFALTERKWLLPLVASSLISILLVVAALVRSGDSRRPEGPPSKLKFEFESGLTDRMPAAPRLAYLISGSEGDGQRIKRLLGAIYHPRNQYLLHLDKAARDAERISLGLYVQSVPVFAAAGNVNVIGKADFVSYRGPTAIASTLHAAALLLRYSRNWDWFINLSPSDYPLITQDDLLHVFSYLPRDLNFIEHSSDIGWKEYHRIKPIIIDPGLSMLGRSQIFYATQKRMVPNAYKTFTGSAFFVLSRNFMEYCILGWDNLPRTVLIYSANSLLSEEAYFQTVICNAQEFRNTTVNNDLRYVAWDNPPKSEPYYLNSTDYKKMMQSGAAFARQFREDDPILDRIDRVVLHRQHEWVTPGGWCLGKSNKKKDPCSVWGDISILKPGSRAKVFEKSLSRLLANETFRSNQCKLE